jgi:hypothetical protein
MRRRHLRMTRIDDDFDAEEGTVDPSSSVG